VGVGGGLAAADTFRQRRALSLGASGNRGSAFVSVFESGPDQGPKIAPHGWEVEGYGFSGTPMLGSLPDPLSPFHLVVGLPAQTTRANREQVRAEKTRLYRDTRNPASTRPGSRPSFGLTQCGLPDLRSTFPLPALAQPGDGDHLRGLWLIGIIGPPFASSLRIGDLLFSGRDQR